MVAQVYASVRRRIARPRPLLVAARVASLPLGAVGDRGGPLHNRCGFDTLGAALAAVRGTVARLGVSTATSADWCAPCRCGGFVLPLAWYQGWAPPQRWRFGHLLSYFATPQGSRYPTWRVHDNDRLKVAVWLRGMVLPLA